VFAAIGLPASCGLVVILALVGLHVIGNALGTTLRDEATRSTALDQTAPYPLPSDQFSQPVFVGDDSSRSVSGLSQHTPLGWVILAATLLGAATGAWIGQWILVNFAVVALRGIVLGAISSGLLGGLGGFMLGSVSQTWLGAWRQATAAADQSDRRPMAKIHLPCLSSSVPAVLVADLDAG
jgi:hypothetical protein